MSGAVEQRLEVEVGGRVLPCILMEPGRGALARSPTLLFNFCGAGRAALHEHPYNLPARRFLDVGHRVLSFDLPAHGERRGPGGTAGLEGMRHALLAGEDPFRRFVSEATAVLDHVLRAGLAGPQGVCAYGTSRAGYCVLRWAAADRRVRAAAAGAPVTDWRLLAEFAAVRDRPDVGALALEHFADALSGRAVHVVIGDRDGRVGTESCVRFALRVLEAEARGGLGSSAFSLHVIPTEGHTVPDEWRLAGAEYLLEHVAAAGGPG